MTQVPSLPSWSLLVRRKETAVKYLVLKSLDTLQLEICYQGEYGLHQQSGKKFFQEN